MRDNHIFWVDHEQPTVMVSKQFDNDPKEVRFDHEKKNNGDRFSKILDSSFTQLQQPGNLVFIFIFAHVVIIIVANSIPFLSCKVLKK